MEAENLVVDKSRQGQIVEEVCERLPNIRVAVFAQTFVVEAIDLGDLAGFVVASQDCDTLRISDLQSDE